jgi:hypothetical protein
MTARHSSSRLASAGLLALLLAAVLSACGGSSGTSGATPITTPSQSGSSTTSNSGSGGSTSGSTGSTTSNSGSGGSTGSATLTWQAPDTNIDGTALTNLAGYYIHYGTDTANLDQLVKISTVGISTYVIDNLASGTYYFAVSSYTATGVESALSAVVSINI